jgi:hypothetical protein
MREYVQAEVKLALTEATKTGLHPSELEPLREQVTRFETEVRRLIDALPTVQVNQLDEAQLRALNSLVPYGHKP